MLRYRHFKVIFLLAFGSLLFFAGRTSKNKTPFEFPELKFFPEMPKLGPWAVTVEGVDLGRHLFYDPILSADSSFSCSTCHKQEAAFSDPGSQFSVGINGDSMTRNTMPLFNLAWYPAFFWDGRASSIEDQILHPVRDPMEMDLRWTDAAFRMANSSFYRNKFFAAYGNEKIDSSLIVNAIGQFLRILISHNSKYDNVLNGQGYLNETEYDGFVLVNDQTKGDCLHCHTTDSDALGTTATFSNNGLDAIYKVDGYKDKGLGGTTGKVHQIGQFKIPSLRNIAVTAPYMHDGRFETLEEVLDFYSDGLKNSANIDTKMQFAHRGGAHLTSDEKKDIISFLHTLTDHQFLKDTSFSDPFIK